jgi:hypothetical protein
MGWFAFFSLAAAVVIAAVVYAVAAEDIRHQHFAAAS